MASVRSSVPMSAPPAEDFIDLVRRKSRKAINKSSNTELKEPEDVDELEHRFNALQLKTARPSELRGSDVPTKFRMRVKVTSPVKTDNTITLREPGVAAVSLELPIFRTYNYHKGYATSTVALLLRGSNDPLLVAISGWSIPFKHNYQLENRVWTDRVFELCKLIGHNLKISPLQDQKVRGRYCACHAEKQLAAYCYFETPGCSATIHLSNVPCQDCVLFFCVLAEKKLMKVKLTTHFLTTPKANYPSFLSAFVDTERIKVTVETKSLTIAF
ncbi:hypothetical protein LTR08_002302 [Meristemomyces frigidus]|nr:hypothetical protein LTR08_002302 [Meristemomyces frigidus]